MVNLKSLNLDELMGVVNLYPWYGAARKELCLRMSRMGGDSWGEEEYARAAMYVGSRRIISDIMRAGSKVDCSDKDVENLIRSYMGAQQPEAPAAPAEAAEKASQKPRSVGGDFFSQSEYEKVRRSEDKVFSSFAAKGERTVAADVERILLTDFCTETLAQIYLEQGYLEQAKFIYSQLILRYPEKNAYFAGLIAEIDKNINNQ